jgi:hypothetical protein
MSIVQNAGAGRGSFGFYNDTVNQSLRFEDGDNAYLNKTLSASNGTIFTFSCWVKLGNIGINRCLLQGYDDANNFTQILLYSSNQVGIYSSTSNTARLYAVTTALLRDTGAWYNIVVKFNGTSSSEEFKIYVNGVNQALTTTTALAAHQSLIGNSNAHYIGNNFNQSLDMDGYMAEVNFIDGTALDADSFGETKDGIWIPKNTSGLTFGTNGFRLQFDQTGTGTASTSTIGADTSGQTNHFTSNNLAATDSNMPDCPENNFATFNVLEKHSASVLSEGNLVSTSANANDWESVGSTMHVSSGKWYCEVVLTAASGTLDLMIGVARSNSFSFLAGATFYTPASNFGYYASAGDIYAGGSLTGDFNVTYEVGDIIGIAIDMDNLAVYFAKNNTYINSGDPTSGASKTGLSGALLAGASYQVAVGAYQNGTKFTANFGQDGTFAGAKTAQGNADGNGIGDFYYAPPSGYLAICSSNLPDITIGPDQDTQADDHFNTVLWTGTGSGGTRAISGVGFSPDWVWTKNLTEDYSHTAYDSVRGAGSEVELQPSNTNAEGDGNPETYGYLSAFDSDGFTSTSGSAGNAQNLYFNESSKNYAAWNWLAGTAFSNDASETSVGTLDSEGQINTTAGFSIIKYSGSNSGASFAHGLSQAPELVIIKQRNTTSMWTVGYDVPDWTWSSDYIQLQVSAAKGADGGGTLFTAAPSSTVVNIGGGSVTSTSGEPLIAYCFHSVEGYSKIGQYEGNNAANGAFVYTGFRPAMVIVKNLDATAQWLLLDNKRDPYNVGANYSSPDLPNAYNAISGGYYDFLSNGFKWRLGDNNLGSANSANTYVYYAVAEQPFKFANAR